MGEWALAKDRNPTRCGVLTELGGIGDILPKQSFGCNFNIKGIC
jgi:hypothetical protein